jgi:2-iminobutanoate/2-iminopropanoate deaminase
MAKQAISTPAAPAAIGPYSQAIRVGSWIYTSGQIGLVPNEKRLISDDITEQTQQVLANLGHVLHAAGVGFENVVKSTIYLTDLNDFATVNRLYGDAFQGVPPARSTVQVAALPMAARVEIDVVAFVLESQSGASNS